MRLPRPAAKITTDVDIEDRLYLNPAKVKSRLPDFYARYNKIFMINLLNILIDPYKHY